jgi:hypothetical protein
LGSGQAAEMQRGANVADWKIISTIFFGHPALGGVDLKKSGRREKWPPSVTRKNE